MKDRGMIKWMPFDSVVSSKKVVQSIIQEKSKVLKPILSEEQMTEIENRLWEGFHNQITIHISYYFQGTIRKKDSIILCIQRNEKKIIFKDYSYLYFDQILNVSI